MGYLDRRKILAYNPILALIALKRGYGKTWTFKTLGIDNYLKNGSQMVWLRRYKDELKEAKDKFIGDIADHYPDHKLSISGDWLSVDGNKVIFFSTLTKAQYIKSSALPKVEHLVFDEFIIEGGTSRYLTNECVAFCSILSSVFRDRPIKAFLLGNKTNLINPYSIYFNLPDFDGIHFDKKRRILVYAKDNDDIIEENYIKSDLNTVLYGTTYYDFALKNKTLAQTSDYVVNRPKTLQCSFIISINNVLVGCFFDNNNGKIYFDEKYDKTINKSYTIDPFNISKSFLLLNKNNPIYKILKEALYLGRIYYCSERTKIICENLIKFLK